MIRAYLSVQVTGSIVPKSSQSIASGISIPMTIPMNSTVVFDM